MLSFKRFVAVGILSLSFIAVRAEGMDFVCNSSTDLVSCYIWRGLYNGGLSFQPDLSLGWEGEKTSISLGSWWNVGASDWGFRSGLPQTEDNNPNTQLTKEVDVYVSANLWGAVFGITHYYYFDGNNFFNFGDINKIQGSAQTEANIGYDFSSLFPDIDLQLMWNTMFSGDDSKIDGKRCFSTYIEASYCRAFNNGFSLTGVVGISPWKSKYTDMDIEGKARNFAVNNLTLRLDKTWGLGNGELALFVQGTMNTCNLNRDNAIIRASGDNILEKQKLMAALGINFTIGNR